jgi:hypothetical protein
MAYDSGYGEKLPDIIYTGLHFDPNTKLIKEIEVLPASGLILIDRYNYKVNDSNPLYKPWHNTFSAYANLKWKELFSKRSIPRRGTDNLAKKACSIQEDERDFIYMDVGRWGGNLEIETDCPAHESQQRDFGLICGYHAVLCRFNSKGKGLSRHKKTTIPDEANDPFIKRIKRFFQIICQKYGVMIIKWETITRNIKEENIINIFLGDLHLPVCLEPKHKVVGPPGDTRTVIDDIFTGKVLDSDYTKVKNQEDLRKWYEKYIKGDIFRGADKDLEIFLDLLEQIKEVTKADVEVRFFQLGDMYDLWIGFKSYYEKFDRPPGKVKLVNLDKEWQYRIPNEFINSEDFIYYYVRKTNSCFPKLIERFNKLNVKQKIILYGNHDCYLAVYNPGKEKLQRSYRENNLYCEHGHWIDDWNYDGNKNGHSTTERVFAYPTIRKFDPDRRYNYIVGSTLEYYDNPNFSFFVMGHTHFPFLTKVRIVNIEY